MKQIKLTNEEIGSLCMSLSHLMHAGIGVGDALLLLSQDEQDAACKKLLEDMAHQADEGISLAAVFQKTGCFPSYVCTLLQVGEHVGKTEETLNSLAHYYREQGQLTRQLRAALLYPAMLLGVLLIVMVILLVWVLPIFNQVYAQLGSRLTGIAGGLLAFGVVLRQILPYLCGLLAICLIVGVIPPIRKAIFSFWRRHRSDRGVFAAINMARFVQVLSMALSSGMTPQEAVLLASVLSQGEAPAFHNRCDKCVSLLNGGSTLAQALRQSGFLTPADCRLLEAGTRSGRSEAVLESIAEDLANKSQERLYGLMSKVEPAMVVVACALIGTVLLSVMLPLMHIMTSIG